MVLFCASAGNANAKANSAVTLRKRPKLMQVSTIPSSCLSVSALNGTFSHHAATLRNRIRAGGHQHGLLRAAGKGHPRHTLQDTTPARPCGLRKPPAHVAIQAMMLAATRKLGARVRLAM